MLDALARFISRYAKIILAVWVVAILVIVPTAVKSFDSTELSLSGVSNESTEGQKILEEYFRSTGIEDNPVLVLSYDSPEGYKQFHVGEEYDDVATFIIDWFQNDLVWKNKLEKSGGVYVLDYSVKQDSGLVAIGFKYSGNQSFDAVVNDTPNLRTAVNHAIDDYLSYISVPNKQFNSYVTGNTAILYDSKTETINTLVLAIVVVLIIAVVLMGLFFGSVLTSVVSTVNIVFSAIVAMFLMKLLTSAIAIPTIIWLIVMFLCVAMAFAFCVLFISTYRRQLKMGIEKDSALAHTIANTSKIFLVTGLCVIAAGIVFSFCDSTIIRPLGLCLIIAMLSVIAVSMTVPASIIRVTKNELFWTRSSEDTFKSGIAEKYSPKVDKAFDKVSFFSDRFSSKGCLAIVIVISLVAVGCAGYVVFKDVNSESYDLTDSINTGESGEGMNDLEKHSMGGAFQPFTIALKSKTTLGTIESVVDDYEKYRVLKWNDDAYRAYDEVCKLQASVVNSNPDNIYSTTTFVMWDKLVDEAKATIGEDYTYKGILQYIDMKLKLTNVVAYQGFMEEFDNIYPPLSIEDISELEAYIIVNGYGPRFDFSMNKWLSDIGGTESGDKISIDYIAISVFTKEACTSDKVISTTDKINSAVDGFMKDSQCFSKSWVSGVGVAYTEVYGGISTWYYILIAIAIVLILLILYVAERDVIVPVAITISTVISTFISCAIVIALGMLVHDSVSRFILMMFPIFAMTFCVWFGYLQIAMMRDCQSIQDMKRSFNPVIIVTSVVIGLASLLLMFSSVDYISQMGFAVAVMVLIDAFVIRMIFSPAVWKLGIDHNLKFFERYSKE